jgi:hypothetical protein
MHWVIHFFHFIGSWFYTYTNGSDALRHTHMSNFLHFRLFIHHSLFRNLLGYRASLRSIWNWKKLLVTAGQRFASWTQKKFWQVASKLVSLFLLVSCKSGKKVNSGRQQSSKLWFKVREPFIDFYGGAELVTGFLISYINLI